jgi:FKBP-type peptidyl-prolyl cis-trans isomerase FklB
MKMKYLIWVAVALFGMTSCQESDDTPEEFPDWQNKNERAFLEIYNNAKDSIAQGKKWMIIRGVFRADFSDVTETPTDYIVVQVLKEGPGNVLPMATDTVEIHYQGVLLPSTSSPSGLVFDSSYANKYEEGVSNPYKGRVGSFIEGFSTALQYMNRGDYFKVFIPYQLGYKSSASGTIPAYSMLTFYLRMEDFWNEIQGDRPDELLLE